MNGGRDICLEIAANGHFAQSRYVNPLTARFPRISGGGGGGGGGTRYYSVMSIIASEITDNTTVCSTGYSG